VVLSFSSKYTSLTEGRSDVNDHFPVLNSDPSLYPYTASWGMEFLTSFELRDSDIDDGDDDAELALPSWSLVDSSVAEITYPVHDADIRMWKPTTTWETRGLVAVPIVEAVDVFIDPRQLVSADPIVSEECSHVSSETVWERWVCYRSPGDALKVLYGLSTCEDRCGDWGPEMNRIDEVS